MANSKSKNLIRIALFVALLLFIGLKLMDVRARSKTKIIYDGVSELLVSAESRADSTIGQARIHELFGQPTDGFSSDNKTWKDVYQHRGAFRSYSAVVEYSDRVEKLLIGVSTK